VEDGACTDAISSRTPSGGELVLPLAVQVPLHGDAAHILLAPTEQLNSDYDYSSGRRLRTKVVHVDRLGVLNELLGRRRSSSQVRRTWTRAPPSPEAGATSTSNAPCATGRAERPRAIDLRFDSRTVA